MARRKWHGVQYLVMVSLLLGLSTACTGEISQPEEPSGAPDPGMPDPEMMPEMPPPPGPPPPGACDDFEMHVGNSDVRRLTHVEYHNAVRDLLGGLEGFPEQSFAADATSHGFENHREKLGPSALLVEQYSQSAADIAQWAMETRERRDAFMPCDPAVEGEVECGRMFVEDFGMRAFRRPLTDEEMMVYTTFFEQQQSEISFRGGIELTMQAILNAPPFLYRLEWGDPSTERDGVVELTSYEKAARLSFFLWESIPDAQLFQAAANRELQTSEQIEAQARRMIQDPRAGETMVNFHRQWLEFDRVNNQNKDSDLFPGWSDALRASIREESTRFMQYVWDNEPYLDTILVSNMTMVDAELATLYDVAPPADGEWALVELPAEERAGIFTRANFLASHAHVTNGSPILRGVSILERAFCAPPPAPPPSVNATPPQPEDGDSATNRERFEAMTSVEPCTSCHVQIDGVGYGLENYDSMGSYRVTDNGKPVDSTSTLAGTDVDAPFEGGVELSALLANSDQVDRCYARQWLRYAQGRDETSDDTCRIEQLKDVLTDSGGDIREIMVAMTLTPEFVRRTTVELP